MRCPARSSTGRGIVLFLRGTEIRASAHGSETEIRTRVPVCRPPDPSGRGGFRARTRAFLLSGVLELPAVAGQLEGGQRGQGVPGLAALHTASARRYSSTFMSLRSSDHICRPNQRPGRNPGNSRSFSPNVPADGVLCCSSHPGAEPRPWETVGPCSCPQTRHPVYRSCR